MRRGEGQGPMGQLRKEKNKKKKEEEENGEAWRCEEKMKIMQMQKTIENQCA